MKKRALIHYQIKKINFPVINQTVKNNVEQYTEAYTLYSIQCDASTINSNIHSIFFETNQLQSPTVNVFALSKIYPAFSVLQT